MLSEIVSEIMLSLATLYIWQEIASVPGDLGLNS